MPAGRASSPEASAGAAATGASRATGAGFGAEAPSPASRIRSNFSQRERGRRIGSWSPRKGRLPSQLGDGQADEDEAQRVQLAVEGLPVGEELGDLLGRHAGPVVAHPQHDPVRLLPRAHVEDADLLPGQGVHGVHDQVEEHPPEATPAPADDRRVELVDLELDPGAALLRHVAADDVRGEVADVLGQVEDLVDGAVLHLGEEVIDAVVDPAYPADAVAVVQARASRARVRGEEGQDHVVATPQRIEDQLAHVEDGLDVAPPQPQDGSIRREALDGVGVVTEGPAEADRLGLQLLEVLSVEGLGLLDAEDLEIRVEGHVEVNHLVDEPLHAQVVDQELDLGDVLLGAFGVVCHGWYRPDLRAASDG